MLVFYFGSQITLFADIEMILRSFATYNDNNYAIVQH